MHRFHEIVDLIHPETGNIFMTGYLSVIPLFGDRALIVVKENRLDGGEQVTTEEGLELTRRTMEGEHFLWPYTGLKARTAKGRKMIELAQLNFRPKSKPLDDGPPSKKRRSEVVSDGGGSKQQQSSKQCAWSIWWQYSYWQQ